MGKEKDLASFLEKYISEENEKPTHTSISGGRWLFPPHKLNTLSKRIIYNHSNNIPIPPLVEKMHTYIPFIIDLDFKFKDLISDKPYNEEFILRFVKYLWSKLDEIVEIDGESMSEIMILEKSKPYPIVVKDKDKRKPQKYKSKDGLHLVIPGIIMKKDEYRCFIDKYLCGDTVDEMFRNFLIPPSNIDDHTIVDSKFSGWQPYLCSKMGEEHYELTHVYHIQDNEPHEMSEQERSITYDPLTIFDKMSLHKESLETTYEKIEFKEDFVNKLKRKDTNTSMSLPMSTSAEDISEGVFDPYKSKKLTEKVREKLEGEGLELMISLVKCLSPERALEYNKWLDVGLCLHNINSDKMLEPWEEFSKLYPSYANGTSNRVRSGGCVAKWRSFNTTGCDNPLGKGSLYYWAKHDNPELYKKIMCENLDKLIRESVSEGYEAHFRICEVIQKYFEDQFISVDIDDCWYKFYGDKHRWETTVKGTDLKMGIHREIYYMYQEYSGIFGRLKDEAKDNAKTEMNSERKDTLEGMAVSYSKKQETCHEFQKKLLKESYVKTLMGGLSHMFYKKKIIEKFDENVNLMGFENGVLDLKSYMFREGRPEDYITMSTGLEMPVEPHELPISIDNLWKKIQKTENFKYFEKDIHKFMAQVFPDESIRKYVWRWLSKCLSGENRDQKFDVWTGGGGNGKSVLIDLMNKILGDYAGSLPVQMLTKKRGGAEEANPALAGTKGKRLVTMSEPERNEEINVGLMKELTGGDRIKARMLFKDCFEFIPHFKLAVMCNELPNITADDNGTWRRVHVTPFESTFTDNKDKVDESRNIYEMDKTIKDVKFEYWAVPFMGMLMKEWIQYDKFGIDDIIPSKVKDATKKYRNENNILGQFIELCSVVPNTVEKGITLAPTEFEDIFYHFKQWCQQSAYKPPDKKKTKDDLIKWQRMSEYGLMIGKRANERCVNGTDTKPRFNLLYEPE